MSDYIESEFNPCDICDYKRCSNCMLHELAMKFVGHSATDVIHGHWIHVKSSGIGGTAKCSVCDKAIYGYRAYKYCPECGSFMDGVNKDG